MARVNVQSVQYSNVSTSVAISTTAAHYYGACYISLTTGAGKFIMLDAKATGTGTAIHGGTAAGGTNLSTPFILGGYGVACTSGIWLNAVAMTTAVDQMVVYWTPSV